MRTKLCIVTLLAISVCSIWAMPMSPIQSHQRTIQSLPNATTVIHETSREPAWSFSVPHFSILTSYTDYMIGSYDTLPLRRVPDNAGGGYFLTFMGQRQPTSQRRVHYGYIYNGVLESSNEITNTNIREGYSALAVDPISGKPFYTWHSNVDTDTPLEVSVISDAFLDGIAGLFNDPQIAINNPITITAPSGQTSTDNEFIWPQMAIGPSPLAYHRRVYILGRNSVNHANGYPVESPYIAYADFTGDMIEMGTPLTWSYTSIPQMDAWNHDQNVWRRPFLSMAVDNNGKIILMTYILSDDPVVDSGPDIHVFVCDNYGAGTWQQHSFYSIVPSWNPPTNFGTGPGYLHNDGVPWLDNEIYWKIMNSGHRNAEVDSYGRVHSPGLWSIVTSSGTYYPNYNVIKNMIFDPSDNSLSIHPIYPTVENYQPWDPLGLGTVAAYDDNGDPICEVDWNYSHWDNSLHDSAMQFHYNLFKISKPNSSGRMVAVWQNSNKARQMNYYNNTDYQQYETVPEIFISTSSNNGENWSDPIKINSVETTGFANQRPMWVYPSDTVVDNGTNGKLGLMYFHDNTWGSNAVTPPAHPTNDGGFVKFMELSIDFSPQYQSGINVIVTDSLTQTPLGDVLVSAGGYLIRTNAMGLATLYLQSGSYNLSLSKVGYYPMSIVDVDVAQDEYTTLNLSMRNIPRVTVTGTVRHSLSMDPLSGAHVTISGPAADDVTTAASGSFTFNNVIGDNTYSIHVHKVGYALYIDSFTLGTTNLNLGDLLLEEHIIPPSNVQVQVGPNNNTTTITWTAPVLPEGMSSKLLDRARTGYQIVRYYGTEDGIVVGTVTANQHTYIDVSWFEVPEGMYRYGVQAIYSMDYYSEPALSAQIPRYTFNQLTATVLTTEGIPVPDATVSLNRQGNDDHGPYSGVTNSEGVVVIPAIWYGNYYLSVSADGFEMPTQNYYATANQQTVIEIIMGLVIHPPADAIAQYNSQNSEIQVSWTFPYAPGFNFLMGFNVWRFPTSLQEDPEQWQLLTPQYLLSCSFTEPASALEYDAGVQFCYAIAAMYLGDVHSDWTFSNTLDTVSNEDPNLVTAVTAISQISPNPFRESTQISYDLKEPTELKIDIYNQMGQHIRTLYQGYKSSATHSISWDGRDKNGRQVSTGLYFCRLSTPNARSVKKVLRIK